LASSKFFQTRRKVYRKREYLFASGSVEARTKECPFPNHLSSSSVVHHKAHTRGTRQCDAHHCAS